MKADIMKDIHFGHGLVAFSTLTHWHASSLGRCLDLLSTTQINQYLYQDLLHLTCHNLSSSRWWWGFKAFYTRDTNTCCRFVKNHHNHNNQSQRQQTIHTNIASVHAHILLSYPILHGIPSIHKAIYHLWPWCIEFLGFLVPYVATHWESGVSPFMPIQDS